MAPVLVKKDLITALLHPRARFNFDPRDGPALTAEDWIEYMINKIGVSRRFATDVVENSNLRLNETPLALIRFNFTLVNSHEIHKSWRKMEREADCVEVFAKMISIFHRNKNKLLATVTLLDNQASTVLCPMLEAAAWRMTKKEMEEDGSWDGSLFAWSEVGF